MLPRAAIPVAFLVEERFCRAFKSYALAGFRPARLAEAFPQARRIGRDGLRQTVFVLARANQHVHNINEQEKIFRTGGLGALRRAWRLLR